MHYDVNSAFLQRKLHEKVYTYQPEEFIIPEKKSKVCLLLKPIYDSKQGDFERNQELSDKLKSMGLNQREKDQCLYYICVAKGMVIITVFVDDLLFFTNSKQMIPLIKNCLFKKFSLKDLGPVSKCFGLNITRDSQDY